MSSGNDIFRARQREASGIQNLNFIVLRLRYKRTQPCRCTVLAPRAVTLVKALAVAVMTRKTAEKTPRMLPGCPEKLQNYICGTRPQMVFLSAGFCPCLGRSRLKQGDFPGLCNNGDRP